MGQGARWGNLSLRTSPYSITRPHPIQKTTSSYTFEGLHLVFKLAVLGE